MAWSLSQLVIFEFAFWTSHWAAVPACRAGSISSCWLVSTRIRQKWIYENGLDHHLLLLLFQQQSETPATTTSTATVSQSQTGPSVNPSSRQLPKDLTSTAIEPRSTSPPSQWTVVDDLWTDCPDCVSHKKITQWQAPNDVTTQAGELRGFRSNCIITVHPVGGTIMISPISPMPV